MTLTNSQSDWWNYNDAFDQASIVHRLVEATMEQQRWRRSNYDAWSLMYNKTTAYGQVAATPIWGSQEKLSLNVIKNCTDAFVSKMCSEKPKATFLTSGGDWDLQEKAKDLEKFTDGQFDAMKIYEVAPEIVLDSCTYGTGLLHIFIEGEKEDAKVACERTYPGEIFVDDLDGLHKKPQQLSRRKLFDKQRLIAMFPKYADEISRVPCDRQDPMWPPQYETNAELIPLYETWHLRSSKDAKDGKHYVGIKGQRLAIEDWDYDYFPFVPYRRSPALFGFWGIALTDELHGIQREINRLAQKIQQHHHLLGVGHWMVEGNSKIVTSHLNNQIGSIIRYFGTKPHVEFPQTISGDIYQHLWALYSKAYEITGISQLDASSRIPSELSGSGKALSTYADITSERFATASQAYQNFFLNVARQVIDRAREITANDNPKYSVTSVSRHAFTEVQFLKVDLDEAEAVLQLKASNVLTKDPAEQIAYAKEISSAFPDVFTPRDALAMFTNLDVESMVNEKLANENRCRQIVTKILNEGKVIQPRPMANLGRWVEIATDMMFDAEIRNASDERLQMLRDWIVLAQSMLKPPPDQGGSGAPPGAAPPMAPPPMGPTGAPPMPPDQGAPPQAPPVPNAA